MAAIVRTFNYTGTLNQATIPPGTTSIDVHLWGGAGGGRGRPRRRHAGPAGPQAPCSRSTKGWQEVEKLKVLCFKSPISEKLIR